MSSNSKNKILIRIFSFKGSSSILEEAERTPFKTFDHYYCISYKNKKFPCFRLSNGNWIAIGGFELKNPMSSYEHYRTHNMNVLMQAENYILSMMLEKNDIRKPFMRMKENHKELIEFLP